MKNPCKTKWQQKWLRLDCHKPVIQELADHAEKFCGRWYRNDTSKSLLVLVGESNCGKTHTASAIYRFCAAASFRAYVDGKGKTWTGASVPSCCYALWPEVADEFKEGNYGRMEDMIDAGLLVLDDVGAEHDPSKNAANKLCQILTRRERKFSVVTTNIRMESWPDKFDTRIADRLLRNSQIVNLFGLESYAML